MKKFLPLRFGSIARWLLAAILFLSAPPSGAESLRIAYTSFAVVYGPLWLTKEAGIFKKYNIEPEIIYIASGSPSFQAFIGRGNALTFTTPGASGGANLQDSFSHLVGCITDSTSIDVRSNH